MISKISFLMAVFVACSSASANCPHGWTTILNLNKCYKFFTQRMQWYDAENFCVSQGPGGHLVSIHSRFENNALLDLAAATPGSEAGEAWFWIGMNNLRTTSSYTWIDGSSTDFTAWVQGNRHMLLGIPGNTSCS
uniref:C-type lectin domain-containing protein n=1 Tax=Plectus sambesii TaxID=2011161 RepID=A0A914XJE4_9BILA